MRRWPFLSMKLTTSGSKDLGVGAQTLLPIAFPVGAPTRSPNYSRLPWVRTFLSFLVVAASALLIFDVLLRFVRASRDGHVQALPEIVLDRSAAEAANARKQTAWQDATRLIVVAGHAIYKGARWEPAELRKEQNWYLEPFQAGQVETYLEHIRKGIELAANDSRALLLFSGGETRPNIGPRSEGSSYWLAADAFNWYGRRQSVMNRTQAEEYARDSFENLLFSVCRFRQLTGRYPEHITVVSFKYKKTRFETIHREALRYPRARFDFVGVDPFGTNWLSEQAIERERSGVLRPFQLDPYGCNLDTLTSKRVVRNPLIRFHPYPQGCPELAGIFRFCGQGIYTGMLPWNE
jgi:hypothetical protein